MTDIDPKDFIISRKRKKYKFAWFEKLANCFEIESIPQETLQVDVVEIGAGNGIFAAKQAQIWPEKKFAAVDVKGDRLQEGARYALEHGIANIIFVRAHMNQLFTALEGHQVEKIWLTFSDPFPKKRHAKHRLTHPDFLFQYEKLLQGNSLYFKTDAHDFFEWSLEKMTQQKWQFEELSFDLHESDLPEDRKIMTAYESRFVREGLKINFVKARKL